MQSVPIVNTSRPTASRRAARECRLRWQAPKTTEAIASFWFRFFFFPVWPHRRPKRNFSEPRQGASLQETFDSSSVGGRPAATHPTGPICRDQKVCRTNARAGTAFAVWPLSIMTGSREVLSCKNRPAVVALFGRMNSDHDEAPVARIPCATLSSRDSFFVLVALGGQKWRSTICFEVAEEQLVPGVSHRPPRACRAVFGRSASAKRQ